MQKNAPLAHKAPAAKRTWLWLVLIGFLWLQLAGTLHKHVHSDSQPVQAQQAQAQLDKLLPEHSQQNKSDCQLLDLHCGGLALSQALPVLALPVFALPTVWHQTLLFVHRPWLVYQARAPPTTSI